MTSRQNSPGGFRKKIREGNQFFIDQYELTKAPPGGMGELQFDGGKAPPVNGIATRLQARNTPNRGLRGTSARCKEPERAEQKTSSPTAPR